MAQSVDCSPCKSEFGPSSTCIKKNFRKDGPYTLASPISQRLSWTNP